jgi:hypothetical protein
MTAPAPLTGVNLPTLITGVTTARADVLDQLGEAMVVAQHLDRLGDDLIGHFVALAREQGCTWSRIGERMGVSKQAAQQRFRAAPSDAPLPPLDPAQGFARFTVAARNALGAAHDAARAGGRGSVTPAELTAAALAAARTADGDALAPAAEVHRALAPRLAAVSPAAEPLELVPYDEPARSVLVAAFTEAVRRGADFVDLPHLLLALLETEESDGPLHQLGLPAAVLRAAR